MATQPSDWSIGRIIAFLFRHGQGHIARRLAPFRIGRGQYVFLAEINETEGVCQDELAARLFLDKATAARALQALEREGYIERRQDPVDRRYNRLYLTDRARHRLPRLREEVRAWNGILFEGFTPAECEQARHLTGRMVANVLRHTQAQNVEITLEASE